VLTVGFALFFLLLAGSVAIQAQRIEAQHRIDQLEARIVEAEELNRSLRADVAVAESPDTVMTSARDLGMVDPGPVQPLVPQVTPTTKAPVPGG
jgi:cell division protein FtsL